MLFSLKERGQGMVEYALILVLVAVVVIVALTALGTNISGIFSKVNTTMQFCFQDWGRPRNWTASFFNFTLLAHENPAGILKVA